MDWRKDFRKKHPLGGETWVLERHRNEVEETIKQLLDQRDEEIIGKLEDLDCEQEHTKYSEGYDDALRQAISTIKETRKK